MTDDTLMHYGILRRSGRYPWGSGGNAYQRSTGLLGMIDDLRSKGLSDKEISSGFGMTIQELKNAKAIARSEKWAGDAAFVYRLKEKGYSNVAIGERMGINESSVRSLLDPSRQVRNSVLSSTANVLKQSVAEKKYIDIGVGVENYLGITNSKLKSAVAMLKDEGYETFFIRQEQVSNPGKYTSVMVLAAPGTEYKEVINNKSKIEIPGNYSEDGGKTYYKKEKPRSVDSSRVSVVYGEEGAKKDGVVELRRGVDDLSLGGAKYAQVRIAVDGTHYIKGMAVYADDLPKGVDIRFNTNKPAGTPMIKGDEGVLKPMKLKNGGDNPFGASIKGSDELLLVQSHYTDANGKKQLNSLNIVNEEGNWSNWNKSISSQVLSKQKVSLAQKQLDSDYGIRKDDYDEVMSLTNPTVRKKMLLDMADNLDSAAVHLKAAALPRQGSHVILPLSTIKEGEIYAPTYRDGEKVVLIRYPHGGTFEIPELTVNNKNYEANKIMKQATDAVGIHHMVAERLSGADFDGDTVLVIPNNNRTIKTSPPLKALRNFDPKEAYQAYEGMPKMKSDTKQTEMGKISNLITDMTIKGATSDEIARAVKHSMVVIDAEKHNLNYKQSYIDNNIAGLKQSYQGGAERGASTLISRASSTEYVNKRKEYVKIDPKTGEKVFTDSGESYVKKTTNKKGETKETVVVRKEKSTKMYEAKDANTLSSGTLMETTYADYANKLKGLANEARKNAVNTDDIKYSASANKTYASEVASLKRKLDLVERNRPLERKAQLVADSTVAAKVKDNPDLTKDDIKKIKTRDLNTARQRMGAKKPAIEFTPSEWEAIQSGAVTKSFLNTLLQNTDSDHVKQHALPRESKGMSSDKKQRARNMFANGHSQADIADALGVSVTTLREVLQLG